jgi:L-threonylcarbamoyladenylate synthase
MAVSSPKTMDNGDVMSIPPFLSNCTAEAIRVAALALKAGHLVAFPTETVYGLGADARNADAVKKIYEAKGRPTDHPLIVHISSINQLDKWAIEIPEYAIELARKYWPGPMTLVLRRSEIAEDFITGNQKTVGLRVPRDPIALALITEFERISGSAIAAPSANRFGQVSPTSSADVYEELSTFLSPFDLILEGSASEIGIESTIIDCTGERPSILRSGFITKEEIEKELGILTIELSKSNVIKFSGSFKKHYAPRCKIIIGPAEIEGAGFLALSNVETPQGMDRLASPRSVEEFARVLYSTFRNADQARIDVLVVVPPNGKGLATAIIDRLEKSSEGR